MRAWQLSEPKSVNEKPLKQVELSKPEIGPNDLLIQVDVCGVCHTDLHIVEGEIEMHKLPVVPGHQVVGRVERAGDLVTRFKVGDRVGVPWLNWACGKCEFCRRGQENLCDFGRFTGYDVDGGYEEYQVTDERFAYAIPGVFSDEQAAPLLCAGVVGYRALRLAGAKDVQKLGMYGFGASAHISLQIARYWGVQVCVFTRGAEHRKLARELGAVWAGSSEDDPGQLMDASIIFAPAGGLVPVALKGLRKGGTLVLAGIHMSPIPQFDYSLLWGERVVRSAANATREDAEEMLRLAAEVPVRTEVETFPLAQANDVLAKLKRSEISGAAVLKIRPGD
jgi:propanol-preferring alcohol dehydrogenase